MIDNEMQVQSEDNINSLLDKVSELTDKLNNINERCRKLEREYNGLLVSIKRYEDLIERIIYNAYKN